MENQFYQIPVLRNFKSAIFDKPDFLLKTSYFEMVCILLLHEDKYELYLTLND